MPQLRRNPLDGSWVVVAPERAARPDTFRGVSVEVGADGPPDCPFCPGHETLTPPEVARTGDGDPDTPGWRVRVVPNLYPIVSGGPYPVDDRPLRFHDATRAGGAHEVAVFSPDHGRTLADLTGVELEDLFDVVADRVRAHIGDGHEYVQVLVNHGRSAGASIEHPHAQLVAIDLAPPVLDREAEGINASTGCVVCRAVAEDADPGSPLVVATAPAPVWCPWWAAVPFELMVAPREHEARFEGHRPGRCDVARSLALGLRRLRHAVGDVPYNAVVHSAPAGLRSRFHWHVHVWPRLTTLAGFELGTGVMVNQLPPEDAAPRLRRGEL